MNAPGVRPGEGEFPGGYDPASFPPFAVAVDLAIFTIRAGLLAVLLVQRRDHPYLLGGAVGDALGAGIEFSSLARRAAGGGAGWRGRR